MLRLSCCAAVALVASLTMSPGAYARADAGASDMDIRLLCHAQGRPCDDQDALMPAMPRTSKPSLARGASFDA